MPRLLKSILLCGGFLAAPRALLGSLSDVDQELLRTAAAGNTASTGMITRYHAKVQLESKASVDGKEYPPLTQTCEYWRTGDNYRLHARAGASIIEAARDGGAVRILFLKAKGDEPDPGDLPSTMTIAGRDRRFVDTDPWELSMFTLPVGVSSKVPMRVYDLAGLAAAGKVREVAQVVLDGRRTARVAVDLPAERRTYEVWAASDYNWALVKAIHQTYDEGGHEEWFQEYQANGFIEVSPSLYVPTRASIESRFKAVRYRAAISLSDIVVNDRLPPAPPFVLPQSALAAIDESAGTTYRIDRRGSRIGDAQRIGEWYSPPMPAADEGAVRWSVPGWTAVGAAALLVIFGGARAWRRSGARRG